MTIATVIEIPNPLNGAAYSILHEQFYPHLVHTRERQAEVVAGFAKVTEWADAQPPHIRNAYAWAIQLMKDQMERQLGQNEMGNKVLAALETIPRPPESKPLAPLDPSFGTMDGIV